MSIKADSGFPTNPYTDPGELPVCSTFTVCTKVVLYVQRLKMNDAMRYTFLAVTVILLFFVSDSYGVKCIRCNSALPGQEKCADPWPKAGTPELEEKIKMLQKDVDKVAKSTVNATEFKVICGAGDNKVVGCWKLDQTAEAIKPDGYAVKRDCAFTEAPKQCLDRIGTGSDAKNKYCQCDGEYCNGSNNLKLSLSVIISSFCLFGVIRRLSG